MVRKKGLEPSRCCHRQPLKLVRLPIPPLPRGVSASIALAVVHRTTQADLKVRLYVDGPPEGGPYFTSSPVVGASALERCPSVPGSPASERRPGPASCQGASRPPEAASPLDRRVPTARSRDHAGPICQE